MNNYLLFKGRYGPNNVPLVVLLHTPHLHTILRQISQDWVPYKPYNHLVFFHYAFDLQKTHNAH